jgi:hypothetical protein
MPNAEQDENQDRVPEPKERRRRSLNRPQFPSGWISDFLIGNSQHEFPMLEAPLVRSDPERAGRKVAFAQRRNNDHQERDQDNSDATNKTGVSQSFAQFELLLGFHGVSPKKNRPRPRERRVSQTGYNGSTFSFLIEQAPFRITYARARRLDEEGPRTTTSAKTIVTVFISSRFLRRVGG